MITPAQMSAVVQYFLAPDLGDLSPRGLEAILGRPVSSSEMRALVTHILDAESASMRGVKDRIDGESADPLARVVGAFRAVGENLATDPTVRAGVVIAGRWAKALPERRIDPFRTWEGFIGGALHEAQQRGLLRRDLDVADMTWVVVAAGLGAKDLIAFRDAWTDAAQILERTVTQALLPMRAASVDERGG
ncbi:hypothetical protein [Microbacterium trichothecenolyticum]|uniref:TetR family transcriptional regulator n=1 Tax=Microbacterium trichothecenolyticum TaxID=69370 RepID=A0ABU0TX08_MICTR|nr:hypothetical protein [Microbacterium trichothecenolyticum]MDQ1124188.1 hypothetical protein [Microbacterium trichothecenolyticum]